VAELLSCGRMSHPLPLSEAPRQTPLEVTSLDESTTGRRLATLGIEPGAPLTITRRAPFGGPLLVALGGSRLALRRDEADAVQVVTR
jgi:ferrous iron transport protein A